VDGGLQVQLEKDGGGSTRESWMEKRSVVEMDQMSDYELRTISSLWSTFHREQQEISRSIIQTSAELVPSCPAISPTERCSSLAVPDVCSGPVDTVLGS